MDALNKINMVTTVYRISILLRPIEKEKIFIEYMDNNNVVPCFKIGKQKIVKNPRVREFSPKIILKQYTSLGTTWYREMELNYRKVGIGTQSITR
jgi:hypothetical protein